MKRLYADNIAGLLELIATNSQGYGLTELGSQVIAEASAEKEVKQIGL
ncbi:hypothetical protein LL037_18745 [Clostridium estertheticum]|nr:hypothetical protein [Clostridium estertheticum]MBU3198508.1 hypothetical protein [Clostridium estertheticum]WAG64490.1 hypothetical protein LL037_18745 [Clostridium estertheticum]